MKGADLPRADRADGQDHLLLVPLGDDWAVFDREHAFGVMNRMAFVLIAAYGDCRVVRPRKADVKQWPASWRVLPGDLFTHEEIQGVRERAFYLPYVGPSTNNIAGSKRPGPGWDWRFVPFVRRFLWPTWQLKQGDPMAFGRDTTPRQRWVVYGVPSPIRDEFSTIARARDVTFADLFRRQFELHQMALAHAGSSPDIMALLEAADLTPLIV